MPDSVLTIVGPLFALATGTATDSAIPMHAPKPKSIVLDISITQSWLSYIAICLTGNPSAESYRFVPLMVAKKRVSVLLLRIFAHQRAREYENWPLFAMWL